MIPIYSSALFAKGVFSSKSCKIDPILVSKCRNYFDFCYFEGPAMIASDAPISLQIASLPSAHIISTLPEQHKQNLFLLQKADNKCFVSWVFLTFLWRRKCPCRSVHLTFFIVAYSHLFHSSLRDLGYRSSQSSVL